MVSLTMAVAILSFGIGLIFGYIWAVLALYWAIVNKLPEDDRQRIIDAVEMFEQYRKVNNNTVPEKE